MSNQNTIGKARDLWRRQYWLTIGYFCLALACLFVIPPVACTWPAQILAGVPWLGRLLFLALIVGALYVFSAHSRRTGFRSFMRLIGTLKYSLIFGLLLIYLPLTACEQFPLHSLFGGLFVELPEPAIFWVSAAMTVAIWSLAFTQGMTIDGIESRYLVKGTARATRGNYIWEDGYIGQGTYDFFNSRIGWKQLGVYFLPTLVGLGIIIFRSETDLSRALAPALLGLAAGLAFVAVVTIPGFWLLTFYKDDSAEVRYKPLPYPHWLLAAISSVVEQFNALLKFLFFIVIALFRKTPQASAAPAARPAQKQSRFQTSFGKFFGTAKRSPRYLFPAPEHWVALAFGGLILLTRSLASNPEQHPLPHIYVLLIVLIFLISGLDFHLTRIRISFPLVLIAAIFIGYSWLNVDHYYQIDVVETPAIKALNPVDIAKNSRSKQNLVIITSTGGGIWASGWTTEALRGLISERPEYLDEIRLISAVSGGTVGAAHYIHDLCQARRGSDLSPDQIKPFLDTVHAKSVTSSLAAITYGFTFFDSVRLLSAGFLSKNIESDRAIFQENRWAGIAAGGSNNEASSSDCDMMLKLRGMIRAGRVPAFIFNTTTMESGRRVMITPVNFKTPRWRYEESRGDTLSELLFGMAALSSNDRPFIEADLSLWTAARLSAAFPYVTPAARAEIRSSNIESAELEPRTGQYHLIDGGYYDNFGVTAALDWLQPILEARRRTNQGLEFSKVALIELRAFPLPNRNCYRPAPGVSSALIGPPLGLYNIRTGSAFSRNEIEIQRFIKLWQVLLKDKGVELRRFIIEPPTLVAGSSDCLEENQAGPLSWHLTRKNLADLDTQWQAVVNSGRLTLVNDFLASNITVTSD